MPLAPGREVQLARVDAAHRVAGSRCFVCPVGWSSGVYELHGAASAVWQSLGSPLSTAELATIHGVSADDEYLLAAIAMLGESALIEPAGDVTEGAQPTSSRA